MSSLGARKTPLLQAPQEPAKVATVAQVVGGRREEEERTGWVGDRSAPFKTRTQRRRVGNNMLFAPQALPHDE